MTGKPVVFWNEVSPAPSARQLLERAREALEWAHERAGCKDPISAFEAYAQEMAQAGHSPSRAELITAGDQSALCDELKNAILISFMYLVAGETALDRGDTDCIPLYLTKCYYYLGIASGPPTAKEKQIAAARAKNEKEWGEHRRWLVKWLDGKDSLQFADRSEAIRALEGDYDQKFPDATGNLQERASSWGREFREVEAAFSRVCRRQR
jgi:hypothetical protein